MTAANSIFLETTTWNRNEILRQWAWVGTTDLTSWKSVAVDCILGKLGYWSMRRLGSILYSWTELTKGRYRFISVYKQERNRYKQSLHNPGCGSPALQQAFVLHLVSRVCSGNTLEFFNIQDAITCSTSRHRSHGHRYTHSQTYINTLTHIDTHNPILFCLCQSLQCGHA